MEDPNITMEVNIRLEEKKACRHAIVFNDELTSEVALSCETTVSSLDNNKIDFRISFDESDDEYYTLGEARRTMSWRQFILAMGLHTAEKIDTDGFKGDPLRRLCHGLIAHTIAGRGQAPEKVTSTYLCFLRSMDQELLTKESLRGTTMVVRELGKIDLDELERLHIYESLGDFWTWVAQGLERQQVVATDAPEGAEGPHTKEESD
ncbi:hypothetical protein Tco_0422036 [Tanacetum coccineum]